MATKPKRTYVPLSRVKTGRVASRLKTTSTRALADDIGITRGYLAAVLHGRRQPSTLVLKRCAEQLGVKMDELYAYLRPRQDRRRRPTNARRNPNGQ